MFRRGAPYEAREFVDAAGARMPYRLFAPAYIAPGARLPMVVWLHDILGGGADNLRQISHSNAFGARLFVRPDVQEKYPALVVAPQCPAGSFWFRGLFYRSPSRQLRLAMEIVSLVERQYPVDPDRVYLAGQSMGGFAAWLLLGDDPDRFAAAIVAAGGGRTRDAKRMAGVPVWVFHGALDLLVPVYESRRMVRAIRAAGGHPRYTEFPLLGHGDRCWKRVFDEPHLVDWLFAQRRR